MEQFDARCEREDEVLIMQSATYGRMRINRCVKINYGSLGCAADVLPYLDSKCSGRRECSFPVAELHGQQPCPNDLTPFLEVAYTCMKGMLQSMFEY